MNSAWAEHVHERPDTHAPIGVMGDHVMDEGEMMLSYRYMKMEMEGNRTGTDSKSKTGIIFVVVVFNRE